MTKIQALEKTIYNLENDVYNYNWGIADACNCGILAKTIVGNIDFMDWGFSKIDKVGRQLSETDCFSDRTHCLSTNLRLPLVFSKLRKAGFTDKEMKNLEFLKDPIILNKLGEETLQYNQKKTLSNTSKHG